MKKQKIYIFVIKCVIDRTFQKAVNYLSENLKSYILDRGMLKNYFKYLTDSLKKDFNVYFENKKPSQMLEAFSNYVFNSANARIITGVIDGLWETLEIEKKVAEFFRLLPKSNKLYMPYATFCAVDELCKTFLYKLLLNFTTIMYGGSYVFLLQLVGFSLMAGTEACFFYFYSDDYFAMLLDASLQARPRYPIDPNLFYDIDKLLEKNLLETIDINEISGDVDTSIENQTKPKKFDYIYTGVFAVGVILTTGVLILFQTRAL